MTSSFLDFKQNITNPALMYEVRKIINDTVLPNRDWFFYGSRSKGGWTEDSDWDIATSWDENVYHNLLNMGFVDKHFYDYRDNTTMRVVENTVLDFKIQVSFRDHYKSFKAAWKSIPESFYLKYINKRSPNAMTKEEVSVYLSQLVWLEQGNYSERNLWSRLQEF